MDVSELTRLRTRTNIDYDEILESLYNMACDYVPELVKNKKMSSSEQLTIYSLFKQVSEGDASCEQ